MLLSIALKKLFSNEEVIFLSKNLYVKKVSNKGITYTDDFKRLFIRENESGKYPKEIFQECGFNIELLGMKRVQSSANRWRSAFRKNGVYQLQDTRKFNRGRPSKNKKIIKCEIHI